MGTFEAEELQARQDDLDRREQSLIEREHEIEHRVEETDEIPDAKHLDREFVAKSPGTRKGRNPWVLLTFLSVCGAGMYWVIAADKAKTKPHIDDKPTVFETAKARAKVVPGKEDEVPKPPEVEKEIFAEVEPALTREDLEGRKQLEEKRKQAEALRLARLKSAILISGGQGSLYPTAVSSASSGAMQIDSIKASLAALGHVTGDGSDAPLMPGNNHALSSADPEIGSPVAELSEVRYSGRAS